MLNVSGINNRQEYRVNPVFMQYAKNYKNACSEYTALNNKISKAQKPKEADFEKRRQLDIKIKKLESLCQITPKTLQGGSSTKEQATNEAGSIYKLDYYC